MWATRRLASVLVRGDDPNMRPDHIFAAQPLRRAARRVDSFYWGSGLCDDVPALAWYLVGACVPLTLGIAALAALVLGDGARAEPRRPARAASRTAGTWRRARTGASARRTPAAQNHLHGTPFDAYGLDRGLSRTPHMRRAPWFVPEARNGAICRSAPPLRRRHHQ
jgi:hypothetical protein